MGGYQAATIKRQATELNAVRKENSVLLQTAEDWKKTISHHLISSLALETQRVQIKIRFKKSEITQPRQITKLPHRTTKVISSS